MSILLLLFSKLLWGLTFIWSLFELILTQTIIDFLNMYKLVLDLTNSFVLYNMSKWIPVSWTVIKYSTLPIINILTPFIIFLIIYYYLKWYCNWPYIISDFFRVIEAYRTDTPLSQHDIKNLEFWTRLIQWGPVSAYIYISRVPTYAKFGIISTSLNTVYTQLNNGLLLIPNVSTVVTTLTAFRNQFPVVEKKTLSYKIKKETLDQNNLMADIVILHPDTIDEKVLHIPVESFLTTLNFYENEGFTKTRTQKIFFRNALIDRMGLLDPEQNIKKRGVISQDEQLRPIEGSLRAIYNFTSGVEKARAYDDVTKCLLPAMDELVSNFQ